uniref:Uncharacterized protein n=1 Tax=Heterorhabditis bacteriophora TaxID=37862 RepID=A0A1I7WU81_HETBA
MSNWSSKSSHRGSGSHYTQFTGARRTAENHTACPLQPSGGLYFNIWSILIKYCSIYIVLYCYLWFTWDRGRSRSRYYRYSNSQYYNNSTGSSISHVGSTVRFIVVLYLPNGDIKLVLRLLYHVHVQIFLIIFSLYTFNFSFSDGNHLFRKFSHLISRIFYWNLDNWQVIAHINDRIQNFRENAVIQNSLLPVFWFIKKSSFVIKIGNTRIRLLSMSIWSFLICLTLHFIYRSYQRLGLNMLVVYRNILIGHYLAGYSSILTRYLYILFIMTNYACNDGAMLIYIEIMNI